MRILNKYVFLSLICFFSRNICISQNWKWLRGETAGFGEGFFSAADNFGDLYIAGSGAGQFGTLTLSNAGSFLVKYDTSGNALWGTNVNLVSLTGSGGIVSIATDQFGHEYILGVHDTSVVVGNDTLTQPGTANRAYYFISKIDSAGNVEWVKNIGTVATVSYYWTNHAISTDPTGSIYIAVPFAYNCTLDTYTLTHVPTDTTYDILVAKFDSSGNVIWAKSFGGNSVDDVTSITAATSSNIYFAGDFFSDTLTFGSFTLTNPAGTSNINKFYLTKMDSSGNVTWSKSFGNGGGVTSLTSNSTDQVFLCGGYYGMPQTIDTITLPYLPGSGYGFVAAYDSNGHVSWVKTIRGTTVQPFDVALDRCNNIWLSSGSSLMIPDTIDGHVLYPASGIDPMSIAAWTSSGTFISATSLGSGGDDQSSISIDKCGNVYVEGDFEGTFVLGNDTISTSPGNEVNFVAKYFPNIGCGCNAEGEKDIKSTGSVALYPNPTYSTLTITSRNPIKTLTVYDLTGRVVYESSDYHTGGIQLDVSSLIAGFYFVKINDLIVRKFVKE